MQSWQRSLLVPHASPSCREASVDRSKSLDLISSLDLLFASRLVMENVAFNEFLCPGRQLCGDPAGVDSGSAKRCIDDPRRAQRRAKHARCSTASPDDGAWRVPTSSFPASRYLVQPTEGSRSSRLLLRIAHDWHLGREQNASELHKRCATHDGKSAFDAVPALILEEASSIRTRSVDELYFTGT